MTDGRVTATYALIHGGGDVGWYWHLVERELSARGHQSVAPDLPIEDADATLDDHARVVLDAVDSLPRRGELVVVGHSAGGYVAPIVAERAKADRLILVAAMIPQPGETTEEMFAATGWRMPHSDDTSEQAVFYHDVDPHLAAEAMSKERHEAAPPSPGRCLRGRASHPLRSCAATIASSRPTGCAESCGIGSASSRTSSTAATRRRSVTRSNWSRSWSPTDDRRPADFPRC